MKVKTVNEVLLIFKGDDKDVPLAIDIEFACFAHARFSQILAFGVDRQNRLKTERRGLIFQLIRLNMIENDFNAVFKDPVDFFRRFAGPEQAGKRENDKGNLFQSIP